MTSSCNPGYYLKIYHGIPSKSAIINKTKTTYSKIVCLFSGTYGIAKGPVVWLYLPHGITWAILKHGNMDLIGIQPTAVASMAGMRQQYLNWYPSNIAWNSTIKNIKKHIKVISLSRYVWVKSIQMIIHINVIIRLSYFHILWTYVIIHHKLREPRFIKFVS